VNANADAGLNFSFVDIAPGNYHMFIEAGDRTKREDCCDIIASSEVHILDRDVTDLHLSANANDVHGRIKMIGDLPFHPTSYLSLAALPDDVRSRQVQCDVMGNFVIPSVISGRWKLRISNLSRDAAVIDVLQSSTSVFEDGFSIEDKTPEPLEVLLSPAGSVEGIIRDSNGRPAAGAIAFLAPSGPNESFAALYQNTEADASGRFVFSHVAEGDYQLYSIELVNRSKESLPKTMTDVQTFLRSFIQRGSALHVQRGIVASIDLNQLPN